MALPTTAAEVANLQNSTFALNNNDIKYDNYLTQMCMRLIKLREDLRAQENDFFTAIGYPNGKEGIKQFQAELDALNNDPVFRSMTNFSDSEFNNIVALASRGIDYSKPIHLYFDDPSNVVEFVSAASLAKEAGASAAEQFIRGVNKVKNIKANSSKVQSGKFHYFKSGSGGLSGRIATINIHPRGKKKHLTIKMENNQILPARIIDKMENEFGLFLKDKIDGRQALISYFSSAISNSKLRQYIIEEIRNKKGYNFSEASPSQIKGFLGEVRTVATIKYLFGSESAVPTGAITRIGDSQNNAGGQVPIDVIFNGFGIQVKNYSISKKGEITYPKSTVHIGTFITNHLRPEVAIQEILLNFFGSYSFNRPISDKDAESFATLDQYKTIYKRFEDSVESEGRLQMLFDKYVDNMLSISHAFQTEDELFAERKLYFNTFFMYGGFFIPASEIVQAIIDEIATQRSKKTLIKTSYSIDKPTAENTWTPQKPFGNREEHLKYNIHTTITINVDSILERAHLKIK